MTSKNRCQAGAKGTRTLVDREPIARRWLHVKIDGTEEWHHFHPPVMKSLTVDFIDLGHGRVVQQTYTRDLEPELMVGGVSVAKPVRPRGEGWKPHDASLKRSTVWRRPHEGDLP